MKKACILAAALVLLCLGTLARADVFNLGPGLTNLETVIVGDPGNAPDTRYATPGYGSIAYTYEIGKYEVTAAQYCDFLNHKAKADPYGLYNASMWSDTYGCKIEQTGSSGSYSYRVASDWANRPVNFVSFWDSCRFVNWLHNGQGDGSTEAGAYALNGYTGEDGRWVERNTDARWFVPSEDEWYKAAYYKANGRNAGYWDYPTQSDELPSNTGGDGYTDPGNHANYWNNGYTLGSPYWRTSVGEFENSASAYGTYDQGGNVWEWTEAIYYQGDYYTCRALRAGSFYEYDDLRAVHRGYNVSTDEFATMGFRVAAVPEPSSLIVLAGGLGMLAGLRRRKRR